MVFDRNEYQRNYMRQYRKANGKSKVKHPATNADDPQRIPITKYLRAIEGMRQIGARRRAQPRIDLALPPVPPGVIPKGEKPRLAMDSDISGQLSWANAQIAQPVLASAADEGLLFLGYAYLSLLAQRAEYRIPTETIATEMTRKWIKFKISEDAIKKRQRHRREEEEAKEELQPTGEEPEDVSRETPPEEREGAGGVTAQDAAPATQNIYIAGGEPDEPDEEENTRAEEEEAEAEADEAERDEKTRAELKEDDEKAVRIKELEDEFDRLQVRDHFKKLAMDDGFFGRAHLFMDFGQEEDETSIEELQGEMRFDVGDGRNDVSTEKVGLGNPLKRIRTVEPVWTYPMSYNAVNPLRDDWYNPTTWYVMGKEIHGSRLLTFVGRPVPDLLKPSYMFGGLSLSQLVKPYVDLWLDTRQNIGHLVQAFSVMVLKTNLTTTLQTGSDELFGRANLFNETRDNAGLMMVDKNTEDFENVSAPLSGLDHLQAQSQEHMMCCPAGTLIQTARGEVPIEFVDIDDLVFTREGFRPIEWVGLTDFRDVLVEIETGESVLRVTEEHPVWSETTKEFVSAKNVSPSHRLLVLASRESMESPSHGADVGGGRRCAAITETKKLAGFCIEGFGKRTGGRSRMAMKSIIEMVMGLITNGKIWSWSLASSIQNAMIPAVPGRSGNSGIPVGVLSAAKPSCEPIRGQYTAERIADRPLITSAEVVRAATIKVPRQAVYNIEVDGPPEFFANGILVHNSVVRIPAVKFTGIQPTGLNASSEGEIRTFYDTIGAYQESFFRPNLTRLMHFVMLSKWGEIDPDITFDFAPLWAMTEKEEAEIRKMEAETDDILVNGVAAIRPEEVRERIANDPDTPYAGLDVEDVPEPEALQEQGMAMGGKVNLKGTQGFGGGPGGGGGASSFGGKGGGGGDSVLPFPFAQDARLIYDVGSGKFDWIESDHPRDDDGKFSSGGGGGGSKQTFRMPQFGLFKPPSHSASTFAPPPKPREPLDTSKLKKVGGQMGSNPGGVYEDDDGTRFYIKKGRSKAHVREELTAAALYKLAGARTLRYQPVKGEEHIATEMAKLDKDNANKLSPEEIGRAREDFAVHAWLANWDATGLGGDNIGTIGGKPVSLDLGGALGFRAQGAAKGAAFGTKVGELDTLRDPSMNKDAAKVFGGMTPAELSQSARFVTEIPDKVIRETVEKAGSDKALADKLIARKNDIAERAKTFGAEGDPKKPTSSVVFATGSALPVKTLNGVAFKAWEPPDDWSSVDGQADIGEPELPDPGGKEQSSGLIIREPDGRVWIMRPKGGFGGYEGTFPKGRIDKGLSLQANAIKEAWEETGLKARITGFGGDLPGDTTMTRYYVAERESGDPSSPPGGETDGVVLAPAAKLKGFLNRKRDLEIAKTLAGDAWEESKHPRDAEGKFAETAGGGGAAGKTFKTKKEHAAHLLKQGTTTKQMLAALGWPSISMPQMAKTLGMKLEKFKEGGETKYIGTPLSEEEKAAAEWMKKHGSEAKAKAEAAKAKAPAPAPAPLPPAPTIAKPEPSPLAQAAKAFPPPTEAELQKAKKTVALQVQYVPGGQELQGNPIAQSLVSKFNEQLANKDISNDPQKLAEKVAHFKAMAAAMGKIAEMSQAEKAAAQAKAAAELAEQKKKQAEAAAAAAKAEKEKFKKQHEEITRALGITEETELQAFDAFVDHFGGAKAALSKFKEWQSEATSAAKHSPGHGFEKLSPFEMGCIKAYTGPQSGWINKAIINDEMTPAQFMFEKVLNSALDKLPKKTGVTRRGLSLDASVRAKLKPGMIWTHRNFASTNSEGWTGNTKLHITATGKGGAYVAPISSHKGEGETLFKSNLRLHVQKVEDKNGVLHVHCTEM